MSNIENKNYVEGILKTESLKLGAALKYCKIAKGFETKEVSKITGFTSRTISQYEKGAAKISAVLLFRILEAMKISVEDFYIQYKAGSKSIYASDDFRSIRQVKLISIFKTLNKVDTNSLVKVDEFIKLLEGKGI